MDIAAVMDQLAARLDTIAGLRVTAYPAELVTPPAAYVSYPDELVFDETYGRGHDTLTLPIAVVVGKVSGRVARNRLAAFCKGTDGTSVKAVLESGNYTACDRPRVSKVEFQPIQIAGADYLTAIFTVIISGPGSP